MARIDASLQLRPWWWNGIERHALSEADPPERVDVAIVGIGFTGISAALTLARRGREVLLGKQDLPENRDCPYSEADG